MAGMVSVPAVTLEGMRRELAAARARIAELERAGATARPAVELGLTRRELDALDALTRGEDAGDTAARLFLSGNTVKTHRLRLFRKLGVHTSGEAVAVGFRAGVLR